jgi:hypothetical protein
MVIIAALADRWGVRRHLLGKTVWFEIRVPVRARPARPGPGRLSSAALAKSAVPPR